LDIKQSEGGYFFKMEEEVILFVAENCGGCEEIKKHIKNKSIKIVDITKNDENLKFAYDNNITAVPTVIIKNSQKIKKCKLLFEGNIVKAKCNNKEIIL